MTSTATQPALPLPFPASKPPSAIQRGGHVPTAIEALNAIESWTDQLPSRRKNLASAIRRLCKVMGSRPELLRLDPHACLATLDKVSPTGLGVTPKTLNNIRAEVRCVLRRLKLLAPPRKREPITDVAWSSLVALLPARFHPHRLVAFMGYCGAEGIAPDQVTSATLEAYLRHRLDTRGGGQERAHARHVAGQWNKMAGVVPGWPGVTLELAPDPSRAHAIPYTTYPAPLQEEVQGFLDWCGQTGEAYSIETAFLEEVGESRPALRPATVEGRHKGLRLLLWGAVETGDPVESMTGLALLLEQLRLQRVLRWHYQRLGGKPSGGLALLVDTLLTLAAHLGWPSEERAKLRAQLRRARPPRQREITPRTARMLDAFQDDAVLARLLDLPQKLMAEARRLRDGGLTADGQLRPPRLMEAAWMAALAVAIEIELMLPLRLEDLAHLRWGEEVLVQQQARGKRSIMLRVLTSKTGLSVETVLPLESTALLLEYWEEFRPKGAHPETAWLFPNRDRDDRPRAKNGLSEAIIEAVYEATGVQMTTHGFRSLAAELILRDDPHALDYVRAVLGHSSLTTSIRHYARVNRLAAAARLSEGVLTRRKRIKPPIVAGGMRMALATRRVGGRW